MATVKGVKSATENVGSRVEGVTLNQARKTNTANSAGTLFTKENHTLMIIAGVVLLLGFLATIGGASKNPNEFNNNEVYSFIRVTLAPLLVLVGLGLFVYAILKNKK